MREIKEEMNIDAEIVRTLWICQNFFTEEAAKDRFHEICFYFLADVSKTDILEKGNKFVLKEGRHTLTFEWLDLSELENKYIVPEFIKKEISNLPKTVELITEIE